MAWSYVGLLAATGTEVTVRVVHWSFAPGCWRRLPSRSRFSVVHLCSFWNDEPSYGLAAGGLTTSEWSQRALARDRRPLPRDPCVFGPRLKRDRWADKLRTAGSGRFEADWRS